MPQTFANPSKNSRIPEATYAFPLYDGVSVVGFTVRVGPRVFRGLVKEKEQAKAVYDDAVAKGETAGLLEQTPGAADVFTTNIGNIPAGGDVVVEIIYLGELKHDIAADAVRYTLPTFIAPRYGSLPGSIPSSHGLESAGKGSLKITVDVTMESTSPIRSIQSPTHPIAITLGSLSTDPAGDGHEPHLSRASASLSRDNSELDGDFVLLVNSKNVATPKALLETHPTLPNQRALMVTLVPKFDLPAIRPEIVLIADRSGSMGDKINTLRGALQVFLKSMPLGVKFNICSFGSSHTFLWPKSRAYDQTTLREAMRDVEQFSANYGGTEMFEPIKDTIERRYKDLPLEVMLLTDGETWKQEEIFSYLNDAVSRTEAPIRLFSLGIGAAVSHAFIEGVARAGNGFAQSVGEHEKIDGKVVGMLKGALSPHINDYTMDVIFADTAHGDQTEIVLERATDDFQVLAIDDVDVDDDHDKEKAPISLFNPGPAKQVPEEARTDSAGQDRFAHLPSMRNPRLIQAPHKIPPLFPSSRTVVYLLLSPRACQRPPSSVVLRATSSHGPLALEIPVEVLPTPQETLHQLAAKKAVGELEEGRGWIYDAKDQGGVPIRERFEGRWDEIVQREAIRLGVDFQTAGKWCSFVAVEANDRELVDAALGSSSAPALDTDASKPEPTTSRPGDAGSSRPRSPDSSAGPTPTSDDRSDPRIRGAPIDDDIETMSDIQSVTSSTISTGTLISNFTTMSSSGGAPRLALANPKISFPQRNNEKFLGMQVGSRFAPGMVAYGASSASVASYIIPPIYGSPSPAMAQPPPKPAPQGNEQLRSMISHASSRESYAPARSPNTFFSRSVAATKRNLSSALPGGKPVAAPANVAGGQQDGDAYTTSSASPRYRSQDAAKRVSFARPQAQSSGGGGAPASPPKSSQRLAHAVTQPGQAVAPTSRSLFTSDSAPVSQTEEDRLHMLIALQTFEGWWALEDALLSTLGLAREQVRSGFDGKTTSDRVVATVLAVAFMQTKVSGEKETWDLVADKAMGWLEDALGQTGDASASLPTLLAVAESLLTAATATATA
ncbi:MAG: hypothetical protein M1838_000067 [Thelocarpon superellum]|nr:MAG: hypothetical protein M1838_000067 [Thelocarpon superellum]